LRLLFGFIFFLIAPFLVLKAQDKTKKKSYGDFIKIKAPAINYAVPDTAVLHDEGLLQIIVEKKVEYYFDPSRTDFPLTLESDTNDVDPEDFSIVEVDEEYNLDENDSIWVKIAQYYAIWDNKAVNPYGVDPTKFSDSVLLVLYDSTANRYWSPPLDHGKLTDDFGPRRYRWHYGVDLELDTGDSVKSVWDGVVRICKFDYRGYGYYLVIRHFNGLETIYGHLSKQLVKVGTYVKAGDLIGWGGSTGRSSGPHLHFEVRYQGIAFDPEILFDFEQNKLMWREFELVPEHFSYVKKVRKVFYHRVRKGDNVYSIAQKYNVQVRQILKLNGITTKTVLKVGRRIRIR
jgi:murein DD-endopeptidase MepM/ murein hydrolase activator NlpD